MSVGNKELGWPEKLTASQKPLAHLQNVDQARGTGLLGLFQWSQSQLREM